MPKTRKKKKDSLGSESEEAAIEDSVPDSKSSNVKMSYEKVKGKRRRVFSVKEGKRLTTNYINTLLVDPTLLKTPKPSAIKSLPKDKTKRKSFRWADSRKEADCELIF
jgi:hypothetical protein